MKRIGKNSLIKVMTYLMAIVFALSLHSFVSHAAVAIFDTSRSGGLSITHLSVDEELMDGVTSHIYLVATVDEFGNYTITDEFKGCFADQDFFNNNFDYDAWKSSVDYETAADSDKILSYIKEHGISETASAVSDANGKTNYTGLTLGIYYVMSDKVDKDGFTHSFVNFVYPIPLIEKNSDTGKISINYNPSVSPKKSKVGNVHCNIRKRWNDSGYTDNRPSSVTFRIYSDGEFMEDVTLSSDNDWFFEWSKEGDHTFSIEEINVPEGYTSNMEIIEDGHHFQFVVTNSYNPPPSPPDTPGNPGTPDTPGFPDLPEVLGAIRDLPQVLGARRLPQTGQLWWPLPILVIAGVFMIVKGIKKNSKNA